MLEKIPLLSNVHSYVLQVDLQISFIENCFEALK